MRRRDSATKSREQTGFPYSVIQEFEKAVGTEIPMHRIYLVGSLNDTADREEKYLKTSKAKLQSEVGLATQFFPNAPLEFFMGDILKRDSLTLDETKDAEQITGALRGQWATLHNLPIDRVNEHVTSVNATIALPNGATRDLRVSSSAKFDNYESIVLMSKVRKVLKPLIKQQPAPQTLLNDVELFGANGLPFLPDELNTIFTVELGVDLRALNPGLFNRLLASLMLSGIEHLQKKYKIKVEEASSSASRQSSVDPELMKKLAVFEQLPQDRRYLELITGFCYSLHETLLFIHLLLTGPRVENIDKNVRIWAMYCSDADTPSKTHSLMILNEIIEWARKPRRFLPCAGYIIPTNYHNDNLNSSTGETTMHNSSQLTTTGTTIPPQPIPPTTTILTGTTPPQSIPAIPVVAPATEDNNNSPTPVASIPTATQPPSEHNYASDRSTVNSGSFTATSRTTSDDEGDTKAPLKSILKSGRDTAQEHTLQFQLQLDEEQEKRKQEESRMLAIESQRRVAEYIANQKKPDGQEKVTGVIAARIDAKFETDAPDADEYVRAALDLLVHYNRLQGEKGKAKLAAQPANSLLLPSGTSFVKKNVTINTDQPKEQNHDNSSSNTNTGTKLIN